MFKTYKPKFHYFGFLNLLYRAFFDLGTSQLFLIIIYLEFGQ